MYIFSSGKKSGLPAAERGLRFFDEENVNEAGIDREADYKNSIFCDKILASFNNIVNRKPVKDSKDQ